MSNQSVSLYHSSRMLNAAGVFDQVFLRMFAMQLAANIIVGCPELNARGASEPTSTSDSLIRSRMNWLSSGAAFYTQATMLYAIVELIVSSKGTTFCSIIAGGSDGVEFRKLLADGLLVFQEWKTESWKKIQEEHGEHFGTHTENFMRDWTDLNGQLLHVLDKPAT